VAESKGRKECSRSLYPGSRLPVVAAVFVKRDGISCTPGAAQLPGMKVCSPPSSLHPPTTPCVVEPLREEHVQHRLLTFGATTPFGLRPPPPPPPPPKRDGLIIAAKVGRGSAQQHDLAMRGWVYG
jgi:hypothetical protein